MNHSKHSKRRSQQRGIPEEVIDVLASYGDASPAGDGTSIFSVRSKDTRREILREAAIQGVKNMDRYLGTFLVVAKDNTIVTVGHRYRRVQTCYSHTRKTRTLH